MVVRDRFLPETEAFEKGQRGLAASRTGGGHDTVP